MKGEVILTKNRCNHAELIVFSDAVFTGDGTPKPGAVAVSGDRIMAVGPAEEMEPLTGPDTKVYRFQDQLVVPGFHDSHLHLIMSGLYRDSVNLFKASSEEEAAEMVGEFATKRPDDPWVLGFSWYHVFWEQKELPTRFSLDRVVPDRPVFLLNFDCHGAWVNSKALEVCKIDKNTPDQGPGKIIRDSKGEPTGVFLEHAMELVTHRALALPQQRQEDVIKKFMEYANRYGVTSVCDMQPFTGMNLGDLDLYHRLEERDELTVRLHVYPGLTGDLEDVKKLRDTYHSDKLQISGLKQFLDGVPTTYTAFLVEPYADRPDTRGKPAISPDLIKDWVVKADREGFSVRLHACGDGAVRLGLDCIEAARNANGENNTHHAIEHIEVIHPDDIERFARLGVYASMQPEHIAETDSFADNPYPLRLGSDRMRLTWAYKTLLRNGAKVILGSDCPVVDINPILGIYRGVTRIHNDGKPEGGWNPQEKLTVAEALHGYTAEPACAVNRGDELGTLDTGKLADLVVLDRNFFEIPPEEIRDTKVRLTIMGGKVVFED